MSAHATRDLSKDRLRIDDLAPGVATTALLAGGAGMAASLILAAFNAESFFRGFVVNFSFWTSLALGGLFFVILQHLTRAGWSVVVRRIAENFSTALPVMAALSLILLIPMVIGWPAAIHDVYPWTDAAHVEHDHVLHGKQAYLNVPFFVIRFIVYFGVWALMTQYFRGTSIRQDHGGDDALTSQMQARSAPAMLVYALTATFFAVDLLMTLEPHWFSTIFGVYFFAGGTLGFFALLAITMNALQNAGRVEHAITTEHYHDVGKLIFAFTVFWAYIGFSQYMLIWYANLPEETFWFDIRQERPWLYLSLTLLFGHFVVPFLLLISRNVKRNRALLIPAAIWVLIMHWLDQTWLVLPHVASRDIAGAAVHSAPLGTMDVVQCLTNLVGVGGLWVWSVARSMGAASLIPERDPRLSESLAFENF